MQSVLCKSSTNWLFSIAMFDYQRVLNKVLFAPYLRLAKIQWTLVARKGLPFWNLKGNGQRQVFASKVILDLSAFWLITKLFVRKESHMFVGDMNQCLNIFDNFCWWSEVLKGLACSRFGWWSPGFGFMDYRTHLYTYIYIYLDLQFSVFVFFSGS